MCFRYYTASTWLHRARKLTKADLFIGEICNIFKNRDPYHLFYRIRCDIIPNPPSTMRLRVPLSSHVFTDPGGSRVVGAPIRYHPPAPLAIPLAGASCFPLGGALPRHSPQTHSGPHSMESR